MLPIHLGILSMALFHKDLQSILSLVYHVEALFWVTLVLSKPNLKLSITLYETGHWHFSITFTAEGIKRLTNAYGNLLIPVAQKWEGGGTCIKNIV